MHRARDNNNDAIEELEQLIDESEEFDKVNYEKLKEIRQEKENQQKIISGIINDNFDKFIIAVIENQNKKLFDYLVHTIQLGFTNKVNLALSTACDNNCNFVIDYLKGYIDNTCDLVCDKCGKTTSQH